MYRLIPLPLRKRWRSRGYQRKHFTRTRVGRHSLYRLQRVPAHLSEYYDFIAAGIVSALLPVRPDSRLKIYLGLSKHMSSLPANGVGIMIQHEQTIVVGEPDFALEKKSNLHWSNLASKWVRLHGSLESFKDADWIVEYSSANKANVLDSDFAHLYLEKVLYIAPLLGKVRQDRPPRDIVAVNTMFGSPDKGRRAAFLERAAEQGIEVTNLRGYQTIEQALESTAILVNIRQKEYFQTFEELRVLPALLQGVVVITEDSPYLEQLPYRGHIVRSSEDNIVEAVQSVTRNYHDTYEKCFGDGRLMETVSLLAGWNHTAFDKIVRF